MSITTIGRLNTVDFWERELQGYDELVTEDDAHGLYAQAELPPSRPGNDPIIKRYYRMAVFNDVQLALPALAIFDTVEGNGFTCEVTEIDGLRVHLHGGLKPDGRLLRGRLNVVLETWEPKGAIERTKGRTGWRNYALFVDFHPLAEETEEQAERELVIENGNPTATGNVCAGGHFGVRSPNGRIEQFLLVRQVKRETRASMSAMMGGDKLASLREQLGT